MKLNLFAFDEDDEKILQSSFDSFKEKAIIELVEKNECDFFLDLIKNRINISHNYSLHIQNLFKLEKSNGKLYVAQILLDKFYPMSNKNGQVGHREYDFYIIGFTETTLDLGNTLICLETKSDKFLKKFWIKDIEVKNFKTFNDKFKINTNRKQELEHFLNEHLVKKLEKLNDIILTFDSSMIFFSFDKSIRPNQTRIIESLFEKMDYLKK